MAFLRREHNTEPHLLGWRSEPLEPQGETQRARLLRITSTAAAHAIIAAALGGTEDRREPALLIPDSELFGTPQAKDVYKWAKIAAQADTPASEIEVIHNRLVLASTIYYQGTCNLSAEMGLLDLSSDQTVPNGVTHLYVPSMPSVDMQSYLPPDRRIDTHHGS